RHTRFSRDWSSDVCSSDLDDDLDIRHGQPVRARAVRLRPRRDRAVRRRQPELSDHRRDRGRVRRRLVLLREDGMGQGVPGGGDRPVRRRPHGHQPQPRHGAVVLRGRRRGGARGSDAKPADLGQLSHGPAAGHQGVLGAGHRRRRPGRGRAAGRAPAGADREARAALRAGAVRVRARRAAAAPHPVLAAAPDRPAHGQGGQLVSAPGRSSAWREWLAWVAGAAVLVAIAYMVDGYTADLYRKLLLFISLALAFNFLFGVAGQVAFSQIAFYGLGAYSITILWAVYHWPFLLALAATIVICTLIALAVAIPTNRLEGFYLALATLAFSQFFVVMLAQGGSF